MDTFLRAHWVFCGLRRPQHDPLSVTTVDTPLFWPLFVGLSGVHISEVLLCCLKLHAHSGLNIISQDQSYETNTFPFLSVHLVKLKSPNDVRHEKTDLKVFVVVIPKEGWARVAAHILLLV